MAYVPCITNLRALYAWAIWWHVACMLSLAEHWQGRRALSNHVCAHSVISMWHVVCLQHLARACSEQSRSTSVLPINHVIQMPQCLSGFVNHDYYMTSIWLVCLISRAPLAGATPTYPERTTPTQLRAFQTSQVYLSRMPIVLGS